MSLEAALSDAVTRLTKAGVPSPEVDAEFLLAHVLGIGRGEVLAKAHQGANLDDANRATFDALVARRESREPLQHLLGSAPFLSFEVRVGPGVFVPRPETESLALHAIQAATSMAVGERGLRIVDLCAGSGVLAIAMARAIPHATIQALELSDEALPFLKHNIRELTPEVDIIEGSVQDWASVVAEGSVDVVVSNPPYVPTAEVPNDPEVQLFDPKLALYGGGDGLEVIRDIVSGAKRALRPGGVLMLEHSNLQGASVRGVLGAEGFRSVSTEQDLVGRDRFTQGYRP